MADLDILQLNWWGWACRCVEYATVALSKS